MGEAFWTNARPSSGVLGSFREAAPPRFRLLAALRGSRQAAAAPADLAPYVHRAYDGQGSWGDVSYVSLVHAQGVRRAEVWVRGRE
jgi:hypothetical protein